MNEPALSYHEPGIVTVLILSSFLLLLNAINYVLDRVVFCGLIGQILVGIAWGTPGANWLSAEVQQAVMQLGYIGLILLVYEGGLSTNLKTLKANFAISALVALIGISCPIALSFVLTGLLDVSRLQAFAAGAALCSTSLGTTFTVLSTSGLSDSRLGVVLSSAAMMDDVVGLIMVKVVSVLGQSEKSFDAITVVRPILVSVAFAVLLPLICIWIVKPITSHLQRKRKNSNQAIFMSAFSSRGAAFVLHTAVLLAMVTGSTYAGTSDLFAAYLAGLVNTWWSELPTDPTCTPNARPTVIECQAEKETGSEKADDTPPTAPVADSSGGATVRAAGDAQYDSITDAAAASESKIPAPTPSDPKQEAHRPIDPTAPLTAAAIYEHYYASPVQSILKPFFFASIGFSIPITQMFAGGIVWRGFVYATLMTVGKLMCGVCLIRLTLPSLPSVMPKRLRRVSKRLTSCWPESATREARMAQHTSSTATTSEQCPSTSQQPAPASPPITHAKLPKPRSLYPPVILGMAMVARGEIGFLISAVAESAGVYGGGAENGGSSELFLVVTWAILLCTILGPLSVGVLVKRVRWLQQRERHEQTGREDPLGVWGVVQSSSMAEAGQDVPH